MSCGLDAASRATEACLHAVERTLPTVVTPAMIARLRPALAEILTGVRLVPALLTARICSALVLSAIRRALDDAEATEAESGLDVVVHLRLIECALADGLLLAASDARAASGWRDAGLGEPTAGGRRHLRLVAPALSGRTRQIGGGQQDDPGDTSPDSSARR